MPAGRPLKFDSVEELERKIQAYFDSCNGHYEEVIKKRPKTDPKTKHQLMDGNKYLYEDVIETVWVEPKCPTVSALAVALDTSRETLINYESREEYFDTIKKAKQFIEACTEELLITGKVPAAGIIFNLKNNYGWKDKTEMEHSGGTDPVTFLLQKYGLPEEGIQNVGKGDESISGSRESSTQ